MIFLKVSVAIALNHLARLMRCGPVGYMLAVIILTAVPPILVAAPLYLWMDWNAAVIPLSVLAWLIYLHSKG